MKRLILWSLLLFPLCVQAQQQTEYNRKGDEAMRRKDYQDAKMWYEEGVSYCDPYSINQLTAIWVREESMHSPMGPVMGKCLQCLNSMAISKKDTLAIKKLILFYTDGIGTARDENSANSWREMLTQLRNPYPRSGKTREKMRFFAGFSSLPPVAPYGIQIGGISTVGWYVRVRTNMVTPRNTELNGEKIEFTNNRIPVFDARDEMYRFLPESRNSIRKSLWMGTAGLVFKVAPALCLSAGAGYAQYGEAHEYEMIDRVTGLPGERNWAGNTDTSYRNVAIDVDATVSLGKRFYGTAGCCVLNLKYIYPSVGIGIFLN
ncbi:MAG: hypothetical protein LBJ01_06275 [Tannerella sp.]|jgi:hypothetical protein|nr:hypothetical protein [Tannerella sp.]